MEISVERGVALWEQVSTILTTYGLDVVGALVTLILGWIIAGRVQSLLRRWLGRMPRFDPTLIGFFGGLERYVVLAVTIMAVLDQFGVQTASLLAVFGAAGLAIGLALQGTLSNVAAGMMLLVLRPFKVGDYIEAAGLAGTVSAINLFITELTTPDNVQITAPNGQLWGTAVRNYSHHTTRRVDLLVGIGYEDNIDRAIAATHSVIEADTRAMKDPEPMVMVGELSDSSVNLIVRVWVSSADYSPTKSGLLKAIKERFDAAGISIPFPQRSVHLVQAAAAL